MIARRKLAATGASFLGSDDLKWIYYDSDEEVELSCLHGWRAAGKTVRLGELAERVLKANGPYWLD
jgi:hypothetical protein